MGLSADQINRLNKIHEVMARKGGDFGTMLDGVMDAMDTEIADRNDPTPTANADPGDAGALSITAELEELTSGGSGETRTIAAPAAGYCGLKVIRFVTDGGGDIVIAAANVLGFTSESFTLADAGDTVVLMGNGGGKWVQIGGNITPA